MQQMQVSKFSNYEWEIQFQKIIIPNPFNKKSLCLDGEIYTSLG